MGYNESDFSWKFFDYFSLVSFFSFSFLVLHSGRRQRTLFDWMVLGQSLLDRFEKSLREHRARRTFSFRTIQSRSLFSNHFNEKENNSRNFQDVKNRSKRNIETPTVSPSLTKIYRHGPLEYTSVPPFPVSFFMLKISLNVTLTSEVRDTDYRVLCSLYFCFT